MCPTLHPGDILFLRKRPPVIGEIVVVTHPRYGDIVKRFGKYGKLSGDNPQSTSTDQLGTLTESQFIGTAILAVTSRGIKPLRAHPRYSPRA